MVETDVSDELRKRLSKAGLKSRKITETFNSGFPDLFVFGRGVTYLIEVKRVKKWPKKETSFVMDADDSKTTQKDFLEEYKTSGCIGFCVAGMKLGGEWVFKNIPIKRMCVGLTKKDFLELKDFFVVFEEETGIEVT